MKGIPELVKQKEFSRNDLHDIYTFCLIQGDLSPLLAVIYIASDQTIAIEDLTAFAKLLAKYPEIEKNQGNIRSEIYQHD
jgi:hypothetical protein